MKMSDNALWAMADNEWMDFCRHLPANVLSIKDLEIIRGSWIYTVKFDPEDRKAKSSPEKPFVVEICTFKNVAKGRKITGVRIDSGKRFETFTGAMEYVLNESGTYKVVPLTEEDFSR